MGTKTPDPCWHRHLQGERFCRVEGLLGRTLLATCGLQRFSRSSSVCAARGEMNASSSNGSCTLLCRQLLA